jgi:PAS domain S-box-containing protein
MIKKPTCKELEKRVQELEQAESERERAYEALKESEERLEALSEASFEAIFLSEKGICLDQNQAAERMFGYTRAEAFGRHGTEWMVPEDRVQVKNNMLSGYEEPYQVTALRKNGTTFPCEIQGKRITYRGRPIRITALRDITDRRQAEKELLKSEERYRRIFENLQDVYYEAGIDGTILEVSPSIEKFSLYKRKELIGKSLFDIYTDPNERDEFIKLILDRGMLNDYEINLKDKDGSQHPCSITTLLIRDHQSIPVGLIGSMRDISERKRAEEALLESEERYRQLFNNESDAVMIFDANSKQFEDANPATLNLFEYTKDEFLNLTVKDISAEKNETKAAVERIISGDSEGKYIPLRYFVKKNGATFPGEIYAGTFISNGRKKIIGAVRDITNRMRAEEAIRELSFSLWNAQEMERKRIASELHDDFGQTLAFLKIKIKNIQNKLPSHQDELKEECENTLKYADQLIEKVRTLSHGLTPLILNHLGLTASLQSLIEDFSKFSYMKIKKDIANIDKMFSPVAEIAIYRIFQEIFTNIEKHANADHVKIEIKKQNNSVYFQIEDNGKGFDIEKIELNYLNEKRIGLASLKERVRMLGGRFKIQSHMNEGTKINFTIPFEKQATS